MTLRGLGVPRPIPLSMEAAVKTIERARPDGIHASFDKVAAYTVEELPNATQAALKRESSAAFFGQPRRSNETWSEDDRAEWSDPHNRVQLTRPTYEAFARLLRYGVARVTFVEFSLCLIFNDRRRAWRLYFAIECLYVQKGWKGRWHFHWVNGGFSTGRVPSGHYVSGYGDKPPRYGGGKYCVHLEVRYLGSDHLAAIGVECLRDLLTFNHRKFWEQHLTLWAINYERLGRYYQNVVHGSRSRAGSGDPLELAAIGQGLFPDFAYDDNTRGYQRHGKRDVPYVQIFLKRFEAAFGIKSGRPRPYLTPVIVGHLLPSGRVRSRYVACPPWG